MVSSSEPGPQFFTYSAYALSCAVSVDEMDSSELSSSSEELSCLKRYLLETGKLPNNQNPTSPPFWTHFLAYNPPPLHVSFARIAAGFLE
jgi:hypothetical protein